MDDLLAALAASDLATALRHSRWSYAAVNTVHVLGIALLIGAILPLDLRLLGWWREIDHPTLVRVLARSAATGLALAVGSGALLFIVRAPEYASNPALVTKLALVAFGTLSALGHHAWYGARLERAPSHALGLAGAISMTCWLGALVSGRLIAYVGD